MNVLAIARLEWKGKGMLWVGVLFALLMSLFVVPWLSEARGRAPEVRMACGLASGLGFAMVMGLLLGSGCLNRDLREGRLGFYFSLPIHPLELLFGKLLGAYLLSAGVGLAILVPTMLVTGTFEIKPLVWLLGLPLFFEVLLAHVVFLALSARSAWLALDLATALGFFGGTWIWMQHLQGTTTVGIDRMLALLFVPLIPILLIAGAVQVTSGRVDLARSHRALSLSLAAGVLLLGVAAYAQVHALRAFEWRDLARVDAVQTAPMGPWVLIEQHDAPRGIVNMDTGRGLCLARGFDSRVIFSGDGSRVAWMAHQGFTDVALWTARLGGEASEIRNLGDLGLQDPRNAAFALSPSGRLLAVHDAQTLSVLDVETGRTLFVDRPGGGETRFAMRLVFRDEEHLRCYAAPRTGKAGIDILDMDLAKRSSQRTGGLPIEHSWDLRDLDLRGDRLICVTRTEKGQELWLGDARSGQHLATLASVGTGEGADGALLADGSLMIAEARSGQVEVRHLARDGQVDWKAQAKVPFLIDEHNLSGLRWGVETLPGRLGLCYRRSGDPRLGWLQVDLGKGTLTETKEAVNALLRLRGETRPEPGSQGARLRWDALSGRLALQMPDGGLKTLVEGRPAEGLR